MNISLPALGAVAACALSYSLLDLVRKTLAIRIRPVPLLFFLALGSAPIFLVWLHASGAAGPATANYWLFALASIALNALANLSYQQAVRVSPLSLTIPFLALSPVFATLLAIPILGEKPGPVRWLGILLVVVGVFWLTWESGQRFSLGAVWRSVRREPGSMLMTGTAFCWALTLPLDKLALQKSSVPFHGLVVNGGLAALMLIWIVRQKRVEEIRSALIWWRLLAVAVVIAGVALAFQLLAMSLIWVGFVETVKRALGSLLAVLFGFWFFREQLNWHKIAAVVLLGVGVALVLH
jgi:drug/metabolite transporter (DMT)-like permease